MSSASLAMLICKRKMVPPAIRAKSERLHSRASAIFPSAWATGRTSDDCHSSKPETRRADTTQLTFPHEKHLQADLKRPAERNNSSVGDCHAPAANGRQMAPISYLSQLPTLSSAQLRSQFPTRGPTCRAATGPRLSDYDLCGTSAGKTPLPCRNVPDD